MPMEAVTPWVDPGDPVKNSSFYVYIDPAPGLSFLLFASWNLESLEVVALLWG